MIRLVAIWDDGSPDEELGVFSTEEEAREFANSHDYMSNPFTREHVDFEFLPHKEWKEPDWWGKCCCYRPGWLGYKGHDDSCCPYRD